MPRPGRRVGAGRRRARRGRRPRLDARLPGRCQSGPAAAAALPRDGGAARRGVDVLRQRGGARLARPARGRHHRRGRAVARRAGALGAQRRSPHAVWGLRVAAEIFARHGDLPRARAAASALSSIAADSGHVDALAALAHALGEIALAEHEPDAAADKLTRALDLHAGLEVPFERAQIALRAGVALAAAGRREAALERMEESYRAARRLNAKPLAAACAAEFDRLKEPLERRLGRRAACLLYTSDAADEL